MKNVGRFDRIVRVVLGLVILSLPFVMVDPAATGMAFGAYAWLFILVGLVLLATGIFGFCPLYRVLGLRTCSVPKTQNK